MIATIAWAAVAVLISLTPMLWALHRQTVRADRAEAALARVEDEIVMSLVDIDPQTMVNDLGSVFIDLAANHKGGAR